MQVRFDPKAWSAIPNDAPALVSIGPDLQVALAIDPRVNPMDAVLFRIFQALGEQDARIAAIELVIAEQNSNALASVGASPELLAALHGISRLTEQRRAMLAEIAAAQAGADAGASAQDNPAKPS